MPGCCGPGVYRVLPYVGDNDRVRRTIGAAFDLTGTSGLGILCMPGACRAGSSWMDRRMLGHSLVEDLKS